MILGAGTAGTIMANRLARALRRERAEGSVALTVVDRDDTHLYQPGLLFVPFGLSEPRDLGRPRSAMLPPAAVLVRRPVDRVLPDERRVVLTDGSALRYDVLIVASGTRLAPEETDGLTGEGWGRRMFEFYTLPGATALADALARFEAGRLLINPVAMPIKCPYAPLAFAFLADWYFRRRGIRRAVDIVLATPLDTAYPHARAARVLDHLLAAKNIRLVTGFRTGHVDGPARHVRAWDDRTLPFDLLVSVPAHGGAEFVTRSPGLGDELGYVRTDPHTLQARVRPDVFALGDATDLPSAKVGSVAHFQAGGLTENVVRYLRDEPIRTAFDGHTNCFVETGFDRALLLDYSYTVEPHPGRYPLPGVGPLALLKETRVNHWAHQALRWLYWNLLLAGRNLPGISSQLSLRGGRRRAGRAPAPTAGHRR